MEGTVEAGVLRPTGGGADEVVLARPVGGEAGGVGVPRPMGGGAGKGGTPRYVGRGADGVGACATYVEVDALGMKLTHDMSLARESASSACLGALATHGALPWCGCSVSVSSSEEDDHGGLDVPPPVRGAGVISLPMAGRNDSRRHMGV
jgi:hypothetical protein